ncbi:T9SS type A sorting domain-containing protein [Emticicia soli]|uniref:T9SS type A sorting domain-containing protein n=1 Tax=Emticicia soli TaxID=2027878 RepID=A0ABW5J948_9BACT
MKKILLLLLIAFNGFSQVFYLDTTFSTKPLIKPFPAQDLLLSQFPDGTMYLKSNANVFNGQTTETGNVLLNTEGKLIRTVGDEPLTDFDSRFENYAVTPDNKLLIPQLVAASSYAIIKISPQGIIDSSFKFNSFKVYILKIILLKNENIVVLFLKEDRTLGCEVFDKTGKFIKVLDPAKYTSATNAQLTDVVSNEQNEYFLLLIDNKKNAEIIKTNTDFEIDKNFATIKFNGVEAYTHRLEKITDGFLVYQSSNEGTKHKVEKFDSKGSRIWTVSFDRLSIHETALSFFEQTNGSIDLIYFDNKHLKIKANGVIDTTFYDRQLHKNTAFLHAFKDGTYWVAQNKSGIIEKMSADGSIDKNFKLVVEAQKQMWPNQIQKLPNNTYLLDFYNYNYGNSPYSIRYAPYPNAVQVYDNKHKLLYDFFDGKTIWNTYKTKSTLVVRGDGKFHVIDGANKMTVSKDTLQANDVIDWQNNFVYRKIKMDSIIRFKIGQGLDKDFVIAKGNISNFILMNDGRIMVETWNNGAQRFFYLDMYTANGKPDDSFKTIITDDSFSRFSGEVPRTVESINDGFIINQITIGETANIVKQRFLKYDNNGNPVENYQSNLYRGGYFKQYQPDGTIFMNTANYIHESDRETVYNFLKLNSSGKIDTTFTLLGTDTVYGFTFFDDNTLYAVGQETLQKFIRQPLKQDEHFYYKPLPEKIAWDIAIPTKIVINSNIKDIKLAVSGSGQLQDGYVYFDKNAGLVRITVSDNTNRILAKQVIELTRIYPVLIYDETQFATAQGPFEFKVQSSSGMPVKIIVDGGAEHIGSVIVDPQKDRRIKLKLITESNEKYEALEREIVLEALIPLATETQKQRIKYYPNPVSNKLIIEKNNAVIEAFRLLGIDGKDKPFEITEYADKFEASMKGLPQGIYILILSSKEQHFAYKIIKE